MSGVLDHYIESTNGLIKKHKEMRLKIEQDTKIVTENNQGIKALADSLGDSPELDALRKQVESLHAINNDQINEFRELTVELMKARANCNKFVELAQRIDDETSSKTFEKPTDSSKTTHKPLDVLSLLPRIGMAI